MKQFITIFAVLTLFGGMSLSAQAHCGKCDKGKTERSADIVSELQKAGGSCKDKNTTSSASSVVCRKEKCNK